MKTLLSLIILAFTSVTLADFLDAGEAYENKNFEKALMEYQAIAKLGHTEAQSNLAVMYFLGQGIKKSPVQGYAWAALATEGGNVTAQELRAKIEDQLSEDQLKEAEQLAETLQQQLGMDAINSQLAPPIVKTDKTIKQSDDTCTNSSDYTVTPIKRKAPRYPKSALRKGVQGWVKTSFEIHPDGSIRKAVIIDSYPKGVFDEATLKAMRGFRFSVEYEPDVKPYPVTANQTIQYQMGKDTKKYQHIYQERIQELQTLADKGHPDAHYYLAIALDKNSPVTSAFGHPVDQASINQHLYKSAQSGQIDAQYHLGNNLFSGTDGYQDKDKGVRWLMIAAENRQAQAARRLYLIFKANPEINQTEHPAQYWLIQAAEQGELDAIFNYAEWLADNGDSPEQYRQGMALLEDYAVVRPETVLWYQTASTLYQKLGDDKIAHKYSKKADKLAKRLGWED